MDDIDVRAAARGQEWLEGLTHKDWLFDGYTIRGEHMMAAWRDLDWSKAYVDLGPSPAGNVGPYWHVPLPREETVHRLYPKVMQGKWALVIYQALKETKASCVQDYHARDVIGRVLHGPRPRAKKAGGLI